MSFIEADESTAESFAGCCGCLLWLALLCIMGKAIVFLGRWIFE